MDIIESDSFYFALPMDERQYKAMYRLENYLSQANDPTVQTIDFDCAVVASPTNGQIDNLKEIVGQDFDENLKINTRHSEAVRCIIESYGIPTVEATGRFLRFIGKDRIWNLDIEKDNFPDWKFILFRKKNQPLILPSVTVTREEVEQYFGVEE